MSFTSVRAKHYEPVQWESLLFPVRLTVATSRKVSPFMKDLAPGVVNILRTLSAVASTGDR